MAGSTRKSGSKKGRSGASPEDSTVPATRQTGPETATGLQMAFEAGDQEVPRGDERGAPNPPDEVDPDGKPQGLQAESALFVSNGSVPHDVVATPTGPQPVGAVAGSAEDAQKMIDQRVEDHERYVRRTQPTDRFLDKATVGRLGKPELRAIGIQRGYDMPEAGTRSIRTAFLTQQADDENLKGGSMGNKNEGSQQARGAKGGSNADLDRTTRATAPKGQGTKGGRKTGSTRKGGRK
jgi:hypothetical protein